MLTNYWKFQSQNVQIFGYVCHDTSGQNHGPVWKIQSFLSKGICTVILWQDYRGKGNLRKFYWNTVGKSFKLEMFVCQPSKRTFPICVCGRYQNGRQNRKHETDLEKSRERRWSGRTNIISWSMYIWDALKEGVNSVMTLWQATERCSNPWFLLELRKNCQPELQGNLVQKRYLHGPGTWKVTRRNAWKKIANLRIKRLNNFQGRNTMHWRPPFGRRRRNGIYQGIVYGLFTHCSQMSVSGSCWETWHFMVCE